MLMAPGVIRCRISRPRSTFLEQLNDKSGMAGPLNIQGIQERHRPPEQMPSNRETTTRVGPTQMTSSDCPGREKRRDRKEGNGLLLS
ncbi:hypothetical protein NDU88_006914 [Pleurodeles waltl]|uniref:Uncharacterized protein n=1 Tax=Pleurodeles waltl TaxID=8319 RepID=A0AAV7RTD9_PLEWA|nr:hypothetical protein NDU88_006914 [Pleurodeles waltl]